MSSSEQDLIAPYQTRYSQNYASFMPFLFIGTTCQGLDLISSNMCFEFTPFPFKQFLSEEYSKSYVKNSTSISVR